MANVVISALVWASAVGCFIADKPIWKQLTLVSVLSTAATLAELYIYG